MFTDYKFWYIKRDDNGFITEAAIRFYEGTMDGLSYTRTKKLQGDELSHLKRPIIKDLANSDAILYTASDFGRIKTDDELRLFLKGELLKDLLRVPVAKQVEEIPR